ncbi:hypothetical protein SESBI_01247 [Sesbania bispinosa]|nr:hypothetical protein SESBI_01247 [Sesbania bispinosa]
MKMRCDWWRQGRGNLGLNGQSIWFVRVTMAIQGMRSPSMERTHVCHWPQLYGSRWSLGVDAWVGDSRHLGSCVQHADCASNGRCADSARWRSNSSARMECYAFAAGLTVVGVQEINGRDFS